MIPITTVQPELSASQTLASFHQQALEESTSTPCTTLESSSINDVVTVTPVTTINDVVTVTPVVIAKTSENTPQTSAQQQVKLPGGATLVAVTDR